MRYKYRITSWLIGGLAVLLLAVMAVIYHFSFPIEADCSNLEECIKNFYNRGYSVEYSPTIKIHDSVTLGKNKYILIEINEDLGHVVLVQSITGRYKIDRLGYGSGNFREGIIESEGKKYLLYGGRNTNLEIASIIFTLDGFTYGLDIPGETRFFVYTEIDSRIEANHLDLDNLRIYNTQGEDITEKVDLSGGGI